MRRFLFLITLCHAFFASGQENIEVVNVENRAVREYMDDAEKTYTSNNDYRVSVITKYNNSEKYGKKLYWPNGKTVEWTPSTSPSNIAEIRITVSTNKDFSNAWTFNPDNNGVNSYVIRNTIPGNVYYYKVEEFLNDGKVNDKGKGVFRTTGQVRMIQVRNNSNIRDLGGWPTQYGMPVQYGRLYRSGSLERATKEGRHDFVDNLGVVAELDLRHETNRTTSCLGPDKDYIRIGHGMYMEGITKKHKLYVTDLKWIIDRLRENKNVDWHCAIGCDRCGTLSFLIEGLLGLSELDLCRDYELSTFSLSKNNRRHRSPLKSMIKHIQQFGQPEDLAGCFYNYWLAIGMTREELDYFIGVMLDIPNIAEYTRTYLNNENNEWLFDYNPSEDNNEYYKIDFDHIEDILDFDD